MVCDLESRCLVGVRFLEVLDSQLGKDDDDQFGGTCHSAECTSVVPDQPWQALANISLEKRQPRSLVLRSNTVPICCRARSNFAPREGPIHRARAPVK